MADKMRAAGIDETVAFHEERKRVLKEPYHYPDAGHDQDDKFNRRLDVFQRVYESQEMDGTCRYVMNKEADDAEQKIYSLAVRSGKPVVGEHRVTVMNRINEARARIIRRYKGLDADLRSGDPYLADKAKEYLRHVSIGAAKDRWDHAKSAHKKYAAQLQGSPAAEKEEEARNEIEGRPAAEDEVMRTFEEVGFLEKEEFGMLRRELGQEAADEFIENLQRTRSEVVARRLRTISNHTKLHQLEKQLVLQDYKKVYNMNNKYKVRTDFAKQHLDDYEKNGEAYEQFMRERDMSGHDGLNHEAQTMAAEVRQRRAELLKKRREERQQQQEDGDTASPTPSPAYERGHTEAVWNSTAGLVQNPRSFVDPDWWELATDNPRTKRAYTQALRRDARLVTRDRAAGQTSAVVSRQDAADKVLNAMEQFSDFRKDNYTRGYSRSQVLAYDDKVTHEPRNDFIQDVYNLDQRGFDIIRPKDPTMDERITFRKMMRDAKQQGPAGGTRGYERPEYGTPRH
eukprot:TRINITY_DN36237_c0_g1_i1.p1 TRINITY_DN36237_c0_g1~~TRINITY_DN36237_c0_g1_i1.p1  ORF type:complete len:545 (+),score=182.02 TRINITY_DN36237_c0_g1_i1:100-1635(+)